TVLKYLEADSRQRGTFFRAVARVTAGHAMRGRHGDVHQVRYWQLPREGRRSGRPEEYEEEFRRLFRLAVEARLDADRPLIAKLSGGVDSPSAVFIADQLYRRSASGRACVRLS